MAKFLKEYRKWGTIALCCVLTFLFTIAAIDGLLGFDFSKNMYLMSIVATACLLAIISMSWIRILNCKVMRKDPVNLDEAVKPAAHQNQSNGISLKDVELCIKKEGFVPQREKDGIVFKIAGTKYYICYQDEKFKLITGFVLSENVDKDLLLKACAQAHYEIFMLRSYTHNYDNNTTWLFFEVETYVNSVTELDRYFPKYLNVINHALARQAEIYQQMLKENESYEKEKADACSRGNKVVS